MEVRVKRDDFLAELSPMQGIVERRATIPILSHLLLTATEDRLHIAATDLDVSLSSWCEGKVKEEGTVAVQAKKLFDIVRASAAGELTLRIDQPNELTLLVAKSRFKLRGHSAEDFPSLPNIEEEEATEVPFDTFRSMISKVIYAVSSEESRFQLSGAMLEMAEDTARLVATDGHRLALVESHAPGLTETEGVLVPRKALQELLRFEAEGAMAFRKSEHNLSFTVGRRRLICRILEGTFPDYDRVISKENDKHVVAERKIFADAIHRVSLMTSDRTRAIRLETQPEEMVLSAVNPDLGEAREEVPCEYGDNPVISLGVNPDYLRDFMGATETQKVRLELKDGASQCILCPVDGPDERYLCVIMPIRI